MQQRVLDSFAHLLARPTAALHGNLADCIAAVRQAAMVLGQSQTPKYTVRKLV